MTVRYHQRRGRMLPTYVCQRDGIEHARRICQAVPGAGLDERIGQLLIDTLTPLTVEAALTVSAELEHRADQADALRAAHVERARYHADLARRRYLAVDPANRLVADTLEADWNTALRALSQAQDAYDHARKNNTGQLTDAQKTRIQQLVTDLPAIWDDPATPARERKRIARLLLTDVTVTRTRDTITAHVRLPGGQHHTLTMPVPPTAAQMRKTPAAAVTAIDELLDHHTHAQIAGILNDRGLTSGEGRPFHPLIVRNIRDDYRLRSREQRLRDAGMLTLPSSPASSACPPEPSRPGTTPGSSPATPTTTRASASTRHPAPTRQPGHKDANSANGAPPATPLPQTTHEPAENVGPHRYRLHQDNNTAPRIDPKRCSMKPRFVLRRADPGRRRWRTRSAGRNPASPQ